MSKMPTYESFAAWYKVQPAGQKRIISKLRKIVASTAPQLMESSKWSNEVWLKGELPLLFIHSAPYHLALAAASPPDKTIFMDYGTGFTFAT